MNEGIKFIVITLVITLVTLTLVTLTVGIIINILEKMIRDYLNKYKFDYFPFCIQNLKLKFENKEKIIKLDKIINASERKKIIKNLTKNRKELIRITEGESERNLEQIIEIERKTINDLFEKYKEEIEAINLEDKKILNIRFLLLITGIAGLYFIHKYLEYFTNLTDIFELNILILICLQMIFLNFIFNYIEYKTNIVKKIIGYFETKSLLRKFKIRHFLAYELEAWEFLSENKDLIKYLDERLRNKEKEEIINWIKNNNLEIDEFKVFAKDIVDKSRIYRWR